MYSATACSFSPLSLVKLYLGILRNDKEEKQKTNYNNDDNQSDNYKHDYDNLW